MAVRPMPVRPSRYHPRQRGAAALRSATQRSYHRRSGTGLRWLKRCRRRRRTTTSPASVSTVRCCITPNRLSSAAAAANSSVVRFAGQLVEQATAKRVGQRPPDGLIVRPGMVATAAQLDTLLAEPAEADAI